MIRLLIAVALGIVLAVGAAFAASERAGGGGQRLPDQASLYQYGNR